MNSLQHRFQRALLEKLAFTPVGPQAEGPGGAPVDPAAAGGAAPMDPMAGGMPPADPMAGGAPPMDPAAMGGMPPMDPAAAGGMPPMDPAAMGGMPPAPPEPAPAEEPINDPNTDVDSNGKPDTMVPLAPMKDFAIGIIEAMKGKKTQDAADPNAAKPEGASAEGGLAPGPVTGLPGDMSAFGAPGGAKLGSALVKVLARGR